jgi:DNA-binding transcriptional MocR family regulator
MERRHRLETICRAPSRGVPALRAQIARRSMESGCPCSPEEVLVTSGCRESLALALRAVCRPGDTVAVQSPVFFTFLESLHAAGLKALEIPCSAEKGLRLDILRSALRTTNIRACLIIPTCNNPLGNTLPEEQTRELVNLLQQHEVPLIEDDVYADLSFGAQRARAAKAFDRKGLVLLCSSFSKSLAPGYQVGWILPGRFQDKIERLKALLNTATASPSQLALAEFLTNGGYNHYLRHARRTYQQLMLQTREAVLRCFPAGTRASKPAGGFVLWVELPEAVDAVALYRHALAQSITILPGQLFTTGKGYRNCIRLNTTFWSPRTESAIQTLGTLASDLAGAAASR